MEVILNKTEDKVKRITGVVDEQDRLELMIITSEANRRKSLDLNFNTAKFIKNIIG